MEEEILNPNYLSRKRRANEDLQKSFDVRQKVSEVIKEMSREAEKMISKSIRRKIMNQINEQDEANINVFFVPINVEINNNIYTTDNKIVLVKNEIENSKNIVNSTLNLHSNLFNSNRTENNLLNNDNNQINNKLESNIVKEDNNLEIAPPRLIINENRPQLELNLLPQVKENQSKLVEAKNPTFIENPSLFFKNNVQQNNDISSDFNSGRINSNLKKIDFTQKQENNIQVNDKPNFQKIDFTQKQENNIQVVDKPNFQKIDFTQKQENNIQVVDKPFPIPDLSNGQPVIQQKEIVMEENNDDSKSIQSKFVKISQNYIHIREEIKLINSNNLIKNELESIKDQINTKINQVTEEQKTVNDLTLQVINILKKLEQSNKDDQFIFVLDFISKRIINKSENYTKENKKLILNIARVFSEISKNVEIFGDFFISILTFRCPFVIPKIYKKSEIPNPKDYRRLMGFSDNPMTGDQSDIDHLNDMECYSYLFFSFLFYTDIESYKSYLTSFMENIFTESCVYPIAIVLNAFIDVLGVKIKNQMNQKYTIFIEKAKNYVKNLEKAKTTCSSADTKSKVASSIFYLQKNLKSLKENGLTDIFNKNK